MECGIMNYECRMARSGFVESPAFGTPFEKGEAQSGARPESGRLTSGRPSPFEKGVGGFNEPQQANN